jgi:hypothetical protein
VICEEKVGETSASSGVKEPAAKGMQFLGVASLPPPRPACKIVRFSTGGRTVDAHEYLKKPTY